MSTELQLYNHPAVRRYRRRLLFRVVLSDPIFAVPATMTWMQMLLSFIA